MKGLGRIQREALDLAARQEGCTTADVASSRSRKDAWLSLQSLARRGLVEPAGTRRNGSADGRGKPLRVWLATEEGRQLCAAIGGAS